MSTTAARAAIDALVLRYNPHQRRDRQGRWADEPGGGSAADLTRANVDLSDDDRQFLSDYVEDGRSYREINDALRGQREMTPEMADKVARLDALTEHALLPGDATLYRAMSIKQTDKLMDYLLNGEGLITDPGYGSASGSRDAVEDFRGTTNNAVIFEIDAAAGQPALVLGDDLSDTAMMQTPQEVLLPRGYRLRIDKVSNRRHDGQMVWTVKATLDGTDPLQPAITAAYNPHQRRGDDGKWIKMGDGLPAAPEVPKQRRKGLRPTASDGVKLPDQPTLKAAPSGSIFSDGWMREEDPADRAAGFWQGRFSDQRAIRQVFRNIAAGKDDPTDGLNLDTNRNWDLTYLRVEQPRPMGVSWEEWEERYPDDDAPRVFDRDDLRNELVSAGRWLHESLAAAPVTRQPLYRGLRMKKADLPEVGDEWESDVISWAEDRFWAEHYAGQAEDEKLGRVGEMEVVLRLNGPKRSVDLGPGLLDEHLTQGRYRVTKVSGRGRRRFVTVEEVPE